MGFDIIVIGGGANGLTAAGLLAKAGRKVLVLERRELLGGRAAPEEFHPGFRIVGLLHQTTGVRRSVADALQLERHGLAWQSEETPVFVPGGHGPGLLLYRSPARADSEIRALSERDAGQYSRWRGFLDRIRPVVRRLEDEPAPKLGRQDVGSLWELARTGFHLKRLSAKDLREFLRIGPMCVADWLNELFETDLLKAALAGPAVAGSWTGPWSAGTVVNLILEEAAAEREVRGGPAAFIRSLEAAGRSQGVEIRTSSPVRRIRIVGGRAVGVELESGESLEAPVVVSSCDPRRTFLALVPPRDLPPKLESAIRNWRCRGTTAKVHLALKGALEFRGRPGGIFEAARTGERIDELERAFDAVKYGQASPVPLLDLRVPTVSNPALAPAGHHVLSLLVHFAPYHRTGGWTPAAREALAESVIGALERWVPALRDRIVARQVLTPVDLEERYGLTGGQIFHGEPALDQLFSLRPAASCSRHATPLPGLFLCGSGTHPGGGITGAPGALAARAILHHPS